MNFPSPLDVALAQLATPFPTIRKIGAQALCDLLPREKASVIQNSFRIESEPGVAKWLALALGKLGNRSSVRVLTARCQALGDCDLRDWIEVALNMLMCFASEKEVLRMLESRDLIAKKKGLILSWSNPQIGKKVEVQQRALLESDNPAVRRWACLALGSRRDFKVDESILEHLSDSDYLALEWTEHVITGKVPEHAIGMLKSNLEHPEPRVREWAIKALVSRCNPGIYDLLRRLYKSEVDEFCREAILRAMEPVAGTAETQAFLLHAVKTEVRPVILAALIDLAGNCPALRKNELFAARLVDKATRMKSPILRIAINRAFSSGLTPHDYETFNRLQTSESAYAAWDFFSNLPWTDCNILVLGEHRKGGISISKQRDNLVVVMIAKKEEFRSFVSVMGDYEPEDEPDTGKTLYHFSLNDSVGVPVHVVAMFVGGMGNTKSALWSHRMDNLYSPIILVNMGIAGGIHEDVCLGDVVIASQVEDYLADAKADPSDTGNGFTLNLAGDTYRPDKYLINFADNLEFAHKKAFNNWQAECSKGVLKLPQQQREMLQSKEFLRNSPVIEEGHIASGPIVGAAEGFVAWLKGQVDRSFLALEMESAGGALALYEGVSVARHVVIRGVSDFGDERKKDLDTIDKGGLRRLAMENATRLLILLLNTVSVDKLCT